MGDLRSRRSINKADVTKTSTRRRTPGGAQSRQDPHQVGEGLLSYPALATNLTRSDIRKTTIVEGVGVPDRHHITVSYKTTNSTAGEFIRPYTHTPCLTGVSLCLLGTALARTPLSKAQSSGPSGRKAWILRPTLGDPLKQSTAIAWTYNSGLSWAHSSTFAGCRNLKDKWQLIFFFAVMSFFNDVEMGI